MVTLNKSVAAAESPRMTTTEIVYTKSSSDCVTTDGKEEGRSVLFNDALNTFYLQLYCVGHIVKDHSDNKRGNPLPSHGLLFPITIKGSFICIIPQTG